MTDGSTVLRDTQRAIGLRGNCHDFIKMAWHIVEPGNRFEDNWHIGAICEHLDAVRMGQIRNLLINVPPGFMKSLAVEVFWPVQMWIRDPGIRTIHASFDATLTRRDASKSLQIMESTWFQERWGDRVILPGDVAASDYTNTAGGFRFSTSVAGKMTGRHCDIMIVDDPIKPLTVNKNTLETCRKWWHGTVPTRFRDQKTARRVIIMQRLHEADLAGDCIAEGGYEHLCLPMRYEPQQYAHTSLKGDIRTEPGELLWPDRVPEIAVASLEKELGTRDAAAQLQQRPAPESGIIFQRPWFKFYKVAPARFDLMIQSWDCAFKGTDTSDFVCGQVWGARGGEFYLLDQVMEKIAFSGTLAAIRATKRKWPRCTAILVEDKANGSAVIETLTKELAGFVAVNPEGGKEARANAVSPFHEAGNVWYPDPSIAPWIDAHVESMAVFPAGKNDDDVDAETQALLYLHKKKTRFDEAMAKLAAMKAAGMAKLFTG